MWGVGEVGATESAGPLGVAGPVGMVGPVGPVMTAALACPAKAASAEILDVVTAASTLRLRPLRLIFRGAWAGRPDRHSTEQQQSGTIEDTAE
jgi:hypothetical protein